MQMKGLCLQTSESGTKTTVLANNVSQNASYGEIDCVYSKQQITIRYQSNIYSNTLNGIFFRGLNGRHNGDLGPLTILTTNKQPADHAAWERQATNWFNVGWQTSDISTRFGFRAGHAQSGRSV